jgi:ubiquinone biosynthesis protein COQ4
LGELGLKWLELFQTGLPIAALSSTVGSLRLDSKEREILLQHYVPWAMETSRNCTSSLLNVYYEEEFDTPLDELRERLNLKPAPAIDLGAK